MKRINSLIILFTVISIITSVSVGNAFWNRDVKKAKEFIQAGIYPKAIELLNKRISDKPADAEAHFLLGICYFKTGNIKNADERFVSAVRLNSGYGYKRISQYINPNLTDEDIKLILSPIDANYRFLKGEYTNELINEFVYYRDGKKSTEADLNYWINENKDVNFGSATMNKVYMTQTNENKIRVVLLISIHGKEEIESGFLHKVNDKWYMKIEDHK